MRLADLVRIDSRFERSVNLLLDLHNEEKLRLYIPTRSSINLILSYLQEITDFHGDRANILIGPYGKGKSHLLLVLLSLLSGRDSEEIRDLINRISSIDGDAAAKIGAVNRDKKFLPVVINTSSGDLGQAFVKSLIRALKSEGMDVLCRRCLWALTSMCLLPTSNGWTMKHCPCSETCIPALHREANLTLL